MTIVGHRGWMGSLAGVLLMHCGAEAAPVIEARAAEGAECIAGGTVLQVDGEPVATVCNGADGLAGAPGEQGEPGEAGVDGQDANAAGVIRDTLYCTLNEDTTQISVYVWLIPGESSGLDNVALCRLGEANFVDAAAMIGTRCTLYSPAKGLVELQANFEAGTVVATGDVVGELDCG